MLNPIIMGEASLHRFNSKIGILSLLVKGTRPAGVASATALTSTSSHVPVQQTPPASSRGICSDFKNSLDYTCDMKGAFLPTSSPYDVSSSSQSQTAAIVGTGVAADNHPLMGGSMDTVNNKQVQCS